MSQSKKNNYYSDIACVALKYSIHLIQSGPQAYRFSISYIWLFCHM